MGPVSVTSEAGARTPPGHASAAAAAAPTLRAVFEEHVRFVGRSLRYLGVDEADLEDACQEVFLVVHRRLGEFEGRAALRTWIYRICVRVAWSHRRRRKRRRENLVADPPEHTAPAPQHEHLERAHARRRIREALDALDEAKRTVFVLYEIERLPMTEIANIVDVPLQTAYSRLHAARRLVARKLEGEGR